MWRTILLGCLVLASMEGVVAQTSAITWGTSKDISLDFADEFVRVGSDYTSFSFATGFGSDIEYASPNPELKTIASSLESETKDTAASTFEAVASSVAQWNLFKNNLAGTAVLTNAVNGTAAIEDSDDPGLIAVSWAMQSSSLDLGVPDHTGSIDWAPALVADAGGGGLVNGNGAFSITDPIVVWVENTTTGIVESHRVFEFTAELDAQTEMHWNDLRSIDSMGEVTVVPKAGPFLDATSGGSGSFELSFGGELVPVAERGALSFAFEDGVMTAASASGVFATLAPNPQRDDTLPSVGAPAFIDAIVIDNNDLDGRLQFNLNLPPDQVVSDIAACSEGLQIHIGPTVDSVQTFAIDPTHRAPLELDDNSASPQERVPRPCFGPIMEGVGTDFGNLLFGNGVAPAQNVTLVADGDAPTIDRHLQMSLSLEEAHKTVILDRGTNTAPSETRRWNGKVSVRESGQQNTGVQILAVGLVDVASLDDTPNDFTLFSGATEAITFSIGREGNETSAQLFVNGVRSADADIAEDSLSMTDWNDLEVSVEEGNNVTNFQLRLVDGDTTTMLLDATLDNVTLSDAGYQLSVGTRTLETAGGHDFDNLVLTHQQNGDVNWDSVVDGVDVMELLTVVGGADGDSIHDTNQDGAVDLADVELLEDLVPNKLPGDANLDGKVDFPDFLALSEAFGQETGLWSRGDFDMDNRVDFPDFLILSQNFGAVQAVQAVPEPSAATMLFLAMFGTFAIRRRKDDGQRWNIRNSHC